MNIDDTTTPEWHTDKSYDRTILYENKMELVKELKSGLCIWKKRNESGGYTYYGESCGIEAMIWDSCCGSKEEFIAIAEDCYGLKLEEK